MDHGILQAFLEESWEGISGVRSELAAVREERSDSLDSAACSLRTIATGGTFLGLSQLGTLARETASLAAAADSPPSDDTLEAIERHLVEIDTALATLEATGEEAVDEAVEVATSDVSKDDEPSDPVELEVEAEVENEVDDQLDPVDEVMDESDCEPETTETIQFVAPATPPAITWSEPVVAMPTEEIEESSIEDGLSIVEDAPVAIVDAVVEEEDTEVDFDAESDDESTLIDDDVVDECIEESFDTPPAPRTFAGLICELSEVRDDLVELALETEDDRFDGPVSRLDRITTDLESCPESTYVAPVLADMDADEDTVIVTDTVPIERPIEPEASVTDVAPLMDVGPAPEPECEAEILPLPCNDDRRTALVIDESLFRRELVVATLEAEGFAVTGVDDVDAATVLLDDVDRRFDVVVCRVESDGELAFAARLREDRDPSTRWIAIGEGRPTGYDRTLERFRARDLVEAVSEAA